MEVNLNGVQALVARIEAKPASPPWYPNEYLQVWLEPEKLIASTSAFGITLPLKEYSKAELQQAIQKEGSLRALEILHKAAEDEKARCIQNLRSAELKMVTEKLTSFLHEN
jgi:hypothetical protein